MKDKGRTAIKIHTPSPGIRWLYENRLIYWDKDAAILDYGAGPTARNARYLKKGRFKNVIAVDPFNYNTKYNVLKEIPDQDFDIAFTCYVLNVVTKEEEKKIIRKLRGQAIIQFHITRNEDLVKAAGSYKKAIKGFETSRGLQRLPTFLPLKGYVAKYERNWKIYKI